MRPHRKWQRLKVRARAADLNLQHLERAKRLGESGETDPRATDGEAERRAIPAEGEKTETDEPWIDLHPGANREHAPGDDLCRTPLSVSRQRSATRQRRERDEIEIGALQREEARQGQENDRDEEQPRHVAGGDICACRVRYATAAPATSKKASTPTQIRSAVGSSKNGVHRKKLITIGG